MKRIFIYIISIFVIVLLAGCTSIKNKPTEIGESHTFEEEEINFEIEQILFSKSFQSIEPHVEVISKNDKMKISAYLGLSEHTKVDIEKIIKKGNEVNIYVTGSADKRNQRFAVPQVVIELKKFKWKNINDLKFNIVYEDYTPLKIKYGLNDIINKVQTHFKVSIKGMPEYNLIKENDNIIWEIIYYSIFDKENPDTPLVNLTARIDANKGEIITSEKVFISSSIDMGSVLNYIPGKYLLYKKSIIDNETKKTLDQLWSYDIEKQERTLLYSSHFKISQADCSLDLKYISLLEVSDDNAELFILSLDDLRPYKVFIDENYKPFTIKWGNDNILYLIDNNDESSVYSYDVKNHTVSFIDKFEKSFESMIVKNDYFILVEKHPNEVNKEITLTTNWESFRVVGHGFRARFVDEDNIVFLQKDEKTNENKLIIYNLKERELLKEIEENILSYQVIRDGNIVFVSKNINNNQYSLIKYDVNEDSTSLLGNIISDKVYYDEVKNIAYLNIVLPFEDEKTEVIYAIDLNKLN